MRLTEMTIRGFRSFADEVRVEFDPGCYTILGINRDSRKYDNNGSGKTAWLSAIPWILYGVTSTGAKKDDIVNWSAEEAYGELVFDGGLSVRRTKPLRKSESLEFTADGKVQKGDLDYIQQQLLAEIGITQRVFFNSVWISQRSKTVQFIDATPAKRLEILEEILADDLYIRARKLASRQHALIDQEMLRTRALFDELTRQEQQARQRLISASARYQQAAEEGQERNNRMAAEQTRIRAEMAKVRGQISDYQTLPPPDALQQQITALESEMEKCQSAIGQAASSARLHVQEGCPTCRRPFDSKDVQQMRERKAAGEVLLRELTLSMDALKKKQRDAQEAFMSHRRKGDELRSLQQRMSDLRKALEGFDVPTAGAGLERFQDAIDEAKNAILGVQKNLQEHEQVLHRLSKQIPLYKFAEEGFGSGGIRTMLMDDVRAVLTHYVRLYEVMLQGDSMHVEFPQASGGFEILVHGPKGPADISCFSTGEVWRANLCVLLAMRKALQFLGSTSLDMLLLDDPVGTLDQTGQRGVVEAAQTLAEEFGLVFLTLPHKVDNVPPDSIIVVEKINGRSSITSSEVLS